MSSNIYEDINMTSTVRYCKGIRRDRGDRQEKVVDIYESASAVTDHQVDASTQDGEGKSECIVLTVKQSKCMNAKGVGEVTFTDDTVNVWMYQGAHNQIHYLVVQRNLFRSATVVLALLCFLLLLGIAYLFHLYYTLVSKEQLLIKDVELKSNSDCHSEKESQAEDNALGWRRFKCHCYYTSTEMKTWAESKEDCQKRGAHLVVINNKEEQQFVSMLNKNGDFWIGLEGTMEWKSPWKWVDGSPLKFTAWKEGVKLIHMNKTKVYIDLQGKWNHTSSGAKRWVCERQIY